MALRKFSRYMKVVTIIVIFAFAFSAVYAGYSYLIGYIQNRKVVLFKLDGTKIYENEYKELLANIKNQVERFGGVKELPEKFYSEIALSEIVNNALEKELADKLKIKVSSASIDNEIKSIEKSFGGRDEFLVFIAQRGKNLADIKEVVKARLLFKNLLEKLAESVKEDERLEKLIYNSEKYTRYDGMEYDKVKDAVKEEYMNAVKNLLYSSNIDKILDDAKIESDNKEIYEILNSLRKKEIEENGVYLTRKDLLQDFFNEFLLNRKYDVNLEKKVKEAKIAEIKKLFKLEEKAKTKSIEEIEGLTKYDQLVYLVNMYKYFLANEYKPSEKEIKKWFEENKHSYNIPNTVSGKIYGISHKVSPSDIEEAKTKAEEIKKELTDKNFSDLAKKYSNDIASARKGGDLDWQDIRNFVPEFHTLINNKVNEIVGPIKTEFGYHLVYVIAKDPIDKARIHLKHILIRPEVSKKTMDDNIAKVEQIYKDLKDKKISVESLDKNPILDVKKSFDDETEHSHDSPLGDNHELVEKVFEMKVGDFILSKTDKEVVIIQKTDEVPYQEATLEKFRDRVKSEIAIDYALKEVE